jgi:hypothetical protein
LDQVQAGKSLASRGAEGLAADRLDPFVHERPNGRFRRSGGILERHPEGLKRVDVAQGTTTAFDGTYASVSRTFEGSAYGPGPYAGRIRRRNTKTKLSAHRPTSRAGVLPF